MRRSYLFHAFFLIVFAWLLLEFARVLLPFAAPILAATVLWILVNPIHQRISRWLPNQSASLHSALSTFTVVILIVGPLFGLLWVLFGESQRMIPLLSGWSQTLQSWHQGNGIFEETWMLKIEGAVRRLFGIGRMDFERMAVRLGGEFFGMVRDAGARIARNTILFALDVIVALITVFFLFRDGPSWFEYLFRLVPMQASHKERLVKRLKRMITEIVRGSILTAFFQTLCAMFGYLLAGVPGAVTLGVATGVASFIPMVGTALVWLPMGIFLFMQDHVGKAIFVLGWGAIIVSTFDNLLRSLFIGHKTKLPFLFLFFSILGGIRLYGVVGVMVGPLLVAVLPVFAEIYREHYLRGTSDLLDDDNEPA